METCDMEQSTRKTVTQDTINLEQKRTKIKNQLSWTHSYHLDKVKTLEKGLELIENADDAMLSILENLK